MREEDPGILQGYACQYEQHARTASQRGKKKRRGLHTGTGAGHALFFIETDEIWKKSPAEQMIYVLTRDFLARALGRKNDGRAGDEVKYTEGHDWRAARGGDYVR